MSSQSPRDPRKLDFNRLTDAEKEFATIKAWTIAHELDDRGFHPTYLLLVAQAIVDVIEARLGG